MNGLKVYLKSGIARNLVVLLILASILLITNAFHFLESEHKLVTEVLLSGSWGILILLSLFVPRQIQRRLRYLPGLLILVSGIILFWHATTSLHKVITEWYSVYYYIGGALILLGLAAPLLNQKHYIFLSSKEIRIRNNPFSLHQISWQEVARVEMEERVLEIELRNGRIFRVTPESSSSQHLRAHIDEVTRKGLVGKPLDDDRRIIAN
jgi:asparagine N-glycosylation enzyme membrane subunit Stt3